MNKFKKYGDNIPVLNVGDIVTPINSETYDKLNSCIILEIKKNTYTLYSQKLEKNVSRMIWIVQMYFK